MKNRTALVTGASSGIGLEISKELAKKNMNLVLVARGKDRLIEIAQTIEHKYNVTVLPLSYDLMDEMSVDKIYNDLSAKRINIDMLVNNAGCVEYGTFVGVPVEKAINMLMLNNNALVRMVHRFLPDFIAEGRGRILNVSSITGFQPTPLISVYGATKAFTLSFTEALSIELHGTGVKATALCPGVTDTGMIQAVSDEHSDSIYIPDFMTGDPKSVAKCGVNASLSGKVIEIPGISNKIAVSASRFQPKWVYRNISTLITKVALKKLVGSDPCRP